MGMVGREYTWRGRRWRVVARWRTPQLDQAVTVVAPCCGHVEVVTETTAAGWSAAWERMGDVTIGEDSYCGACGAMWIPGTDTGHRPMNGWQPGGRPTIRNVLIEDVETGERVVRPFRGLRRPVPA